MTRKFRKTRLSAIRTIAKRQDPVPPGQDPDPLPPMEVIDLSRRNRFAGPDDTDRESTAPYVGMLPEECRGPDGSPLRFYRE